VLEPPNAGGFEKALHRRLIEGRRLAQTILLLVSAEGIFGRPVKHPVDRRVIEATRLKLLLSQPDLVF
jgi:hypothetical protein